MKKMNLTKLIGSLLVVAVVFQLNSIKADSQWRQENKSWWNTEGNSWSVGWRFLEGKWYYYGQDGYMKTGWIQDNNGKWYYLNSNGSMESNTTIDGYTLGLDGAWIEKTQNNSQESTIKQNILSNVNLNATSISGVTGIKSTDVTKIVFYDGRGGINKPVKVEDKQKIKEFMEYLDGYVIKKTKNPESIGWINTAEFYVKDKVVMNITFVNPIIINEDYFNITKGELDTETIGKFLKSIDSSYDIWAGL